MARPIKTGLDYIPTNTSMDDQEELIIAEIGLEGYAIHTLLERKVYGNGFYLEWTEDHRLLFSRRLGITKQRLDEILETLFRREIYDSKKYIDYEILTSKRIQETYFLITTSARRKQGDINKDYLMEGIDEIVEKEKSTSKKEKELEKIEKPKTKVPLYGETSLPMKIVKKLHANLLAANPKMLKPDLQKWALCADHMLRLDGREYDEILAVLDWVSQDDFWSTNILSMKKLRAQYDQLAIKMKIAKKQEMRGMRPSKFTNKEVEEL